MAVVICQGLPVIYYGLASAALHVLTACYSVGCVRQGTGRACRIRAFPAACVWAVCICHISCTGSKMACVCSSSSDFGYREWTQCFPAHRHGGETVCLQAVGLLRLAF
ncbi:hypothetical protein BC834DRAFT_651854 [Gloeopeniophorella convolvens]|nr:hypothetical protein BC834DRAFT_651854 [Gloeopeniophorella convolvens]